MDNRLAEGFISPPSPGNLAEDIVEEVESEEEAEEEDSDEEDKKASRGLSLGTPDEREDRMYSCVPWPDPDDEVDLRVLKAAMEGDMIAMRELHGLCPKRLKAAHNKYGWTALHLAAFYGHAEIVVEMTSTDHFGQPPDKRNKYGWTPVMAAAWGGREEIVKYLLKDLQCDVSVRDVDGRDLLHACARGGNEDLVKWFVQEFDPPMALTKNGADVLIPAAESGNVGLFDWLVEKYTLDPLEWSKDMVQQPLHNALMYGKLELAQHIVRKYGADLNSIAQWLSALMDFVPLSQTSGRNGTEVVLAALICAWRQLLCDRACCVNGATLMSRAVTGGSMEAITWLRQEYNMDIRSCNEVLGWSALHYACVYRHQEIVQYLLSLGLDSMTIDKSGRTCLHWSICEGPVAIVKDLLAQNACRITRVESQMRQPAVVLAAANGQKEVLEFLLDHYQNLCSPMDTSMNGDTPLLLAVQNGHLAVVKMLIEKYQCSANELYQRGFSPVIVASLEGQIEMLKLLVEKHNGDLFHTDSGKSNALHWAAFGGHLPCVKYLAAKLGDRKFDLNMQVESCLHKAVEGGSLKVVQYLIDKCGLDPKLQNRSNLDCLMLACCHGKGRIVCELIEKYSMNQHSVSEDGNTPLHYAAENGYLDCMKLLVHQYKFDPDKTDSKGQTVLHVSCRKGDVGMTRSILEQFNPDVEALEKDGLTPLHCACCTDQSCAAVVRVLARDYHANMDAIVPLHGYKPLHLAAVKGDVDVMRVLITECGCKADLGDENGRTALHYTAHQGHLSAMRTLVKEFKVDPDVVDKNGRTPMMIAAAAGEVDCMRVLVKELGCNKDAQDKRGLSAIHCALACGPAVVRVILTEFQCNPKLLLTNGESLLHGCARVGYSELVRELVTQYSLNINQPNHNGETPLHCATREGQLDTVKQLKELNCDITACNRSGLTAVELALQGGSDAMVAALLD